jgi:hypothetical protein
MSLLERIRLDGILERIHERWAITLPVIVILLLGIAAVLIAIVTLVPNWSQRQALVEQLVVERNLLEQQSLLPRPDKVSLSREAITLRQELAKAQDRFVSQKEVEDVINQIYGYATAGGVIIDSLQALKTPGAEGEQRSLTAFRLKASGTSSQLLNFVARFERASFPGVELDNLSLLPDKETDLFMLEMDLYFHALPQFPETPSPDPGNRDTNATVTPAAASGSFSLEE